MSEWTPGKWQARTHPENPHRADAVYAGNLKVAYCFAMFGRPHVPSKQVEANAHLIAAAPDLYEALEAAVGLWAFRSTDEPQRVWLEMTRTALARARGEAQ